MNVNTELLAALEELLSNVPGFTNVPGYASLDSGSRPWLDRAKRAVTAAKRASNTSMDIVISADLGTHECTYTPAMLRRYARDTAKGHGRIAYAYVRITKDNIRLCVDTKATDSRPSQTLYMAL